MQKEIWKDIPEYEGYYQVSSNGMVKSLNRKAWNGKSWHKIKSRILKPEIIIGNYNRVTLNLSGKRRKIKNSVIVAMAFLGHKPSGNNKICIDHIDNNPQNDNLKNLQIISTRENNSKDKKGGTSKHIGVSWVSSRKKWISHIVIDGHCKHLGMYDCELLAAKAYQDKLKSI